MASNLSQLIEDNLSNTLASLLSKETLLEQTKKASVNNLKGSCIKINTTFKFENLSSSWVFFIPALSATQILNLMMGDDSEPTEEIDEDTLDALNEVVSNICGGLSTAINNSAFEDLGNVQFSLEGNEKVVWEDFTTTANIFKFTLALDEHTVHFFIAFDDVILPYIETIIKNQEEETDEISEQEEQKSDDLEEKEEDVPAEETIKEKVLEKEESNEIENIEKQSSILQIFNFFKVDENLSPEDTKNAKLKKIIIFVGALFGLVILTGFILFFMGTFDPPKIPKPIDINTTKSQEDNTVHINSKPRKKYITFTINKINVKRLNRKLTLLTKYEILEEDAIEKLKAIEKEKQYKQKQKRLELFAKMNKEESLFKKVKTIADINYQNKYKTNAINTKDKNKTSIATATKIVLNSFIQIPPLKIKEFQSFIKKSKKFNANLSICKNENNRTLIFIGPFLDNKTRDTIIKTLDKKLSKVIKKINLSQDEFDKKCRF